MFWGTIGYGNAAEADRSGGSGAGGGGGRTGAGGAAEGTGSKTDGHRPGGSGLQKLLCLK